MEVIISVIDISSVIANRFKGDDGVRIWNVKSAMPLNVPVQNRAQRGSICSMIWVTQPLEAEETLCFGTALGYVVFWEVKVRKVCIVSRIREVFMLIDRRIRSWSLRPFGSAAKRLPAWARMREQKAEYD